jgi:Zn-dependent protease/CBS domain-containing protein
MQRNRDSRIPGSISAFTAFGVPVRFHFTFLLLAVFLVAVAVEDRQSAVGDAIFIGSLFASVLLHEIGHAVVARRFGIRTLEIVMFPIGGVARLAKSPPARSEFWIALAGPLVNFLIAAIILGSLAVMQSEIAGVETLTTHSDGSLLEQIAYGNLVLALFNLLPAFPMDGGRVLRSVLAIWKSEEQATRIAAKAGRWLAIGMGLYGLISAHFMLLFIAFFIYLGATQEGQAAMSRTLTQGLPVRAAMITKFHSLTHGGTISDAAQLLLDTSQQDFPVLHGEQVVGLLDRNGLMRALAREGPSGYLAGVMERNYLRLHPGTDLSAALTEMSNAGSSCALVMDEDQLVGLLTKEHLSEFLALRKMGVTPLGRLEQ